MAIAFLVPRLAIVSPFMSARVSCRTLRPDPEDDRVGAASTADRIIAIAAVENVGEWRSAEAVGVFRADEDDPRTRPGRVDIQQDRRDKPVREIQVTSRTLQDHMKIGGTGRGKDAGELRELSHGGVKARLRGAQRLHRIEGQLAVELALHGINRVVAAAPADQPDLTGLEGGQIVTVEAPEGIQPAGRSGEVVLAGRAGEVIDRDGQGEIGRGPKKNPGMP